MTLLQVSKDVQEILREGIATVYFWKNGKSWCYTSFWYEDVKNETFSLEDQKLIDIILESDPYAIGLDGYNSFGSYTLQYISWRIKKGYLDNKKNIEDNKEVEYSEDEVVLGEELEENKNETKESTFIEYIVTINCSEDLAQEIKEDFLKMSLEIIVVSNTNNELEIKINESDNEMFNEMFNEFKDFHQSLYPKNLKIKIEKKENQKMTLTKKLENKYFLDSIRDERILSCQDGYRLFTITVKDCTESEGIKLSELLIELYSEEIPMYLYDYEFYSIYDEYFEFQVCVDEEMLKEFNALYKEFKKSAKELLNKENEKMLNDDDSKLLVDEIEEDVVKGVLCNTSTEQNKNTAKFKVGQILYNHGDMANVSGWYEIVDVTIDKFGIFYKVEEIGGERKNTYHEVFISDHDNNNGSTRVVTFEARSKIVGLDNAKRQVELLTRNSQEEEIKNITNELKSSSEYGIKIEKNLRIYFNRLAKDQRTKVINKFQRDKKSIDINLFYCSTFLNSYPYNLEELQELRSKIVKYLDFLDNFRNSVIEEINNYQEQIKNFKKVN